MLKKEIIGILKDKRTFLIILLVLIIPIIDLSVEYKQMNVAYARKHEKEIIARDLMMKKECEKDGSKYFTNWISHPANASFLARNTQGHASQMLLLWLLPFFVLNTKCTARPTAAQPSMIKIVLMLVNAATKKAAAAITYDRGDFGHSLYIAASARIMSARTAARMPVNAY